jgi:Lon protease-like protein
MRNEIILFPLQVVMFPNSKMPLHIFEERYKKMVGEMISSNNEFGIVLLFDGRLQTIGTSTRVIEVSKKFGNGEMDIITEGTRRFKLYSYDIGDDELYRGKVEFLDDDNLLYDKSEMNNAVDNYNRLVELAYKGSVKTISLEDGNWLDGSRSVCYSMAEKCGLGLVEKQQMLEMDTEQDRLDYISTYLENVLPKLKEAERISEIIKSDGYIQ